MVINIKHVSTDTLQSMYMLGYGYRNETFQNCGSRIFKDVINYEINELGNNDIIDTISKFYKQDKLHHIKNKVDFICDFFANILNCKISELRCIWLTSMDGIKSAYSVNNDSDEVNLYYINKYMYPVSDIGLDGTLFVYSISHTPIHVKA